MFTYLGLKNFRAFESVSLELAPITILVGPNNSGKSSIISALRILAQTIRNEDYRIPLVLNGPFGEFGTYKDIVYQNAREKSIGISVGVSPNSSKRAGAKEIKLDLTFAYRIQRREVILRDSVVSDGDRKVYSTRSTSDPQKHKLEVFGLKNGSPATSSRTKTARLSIS